MKPFPSTRNNIIANFAGKAWAGIFSLAFIPIYIRLVGVEVYGLLGIFVSVGALLSLLEMGLGATLNRELSKLSAVEDPDRESKNLVRTFESVYWATGLLLGVGIVALAPLLARDWLNLGGMDQTTVTHALMLMGISIAVQWPGSLYANGLAGLQRQVVLNIIRSIATTLQHGGAVLLLAFVSPSVLLFFLWQAFVGLSLTITLAVWLFKSLPESDYQGRFDHLLLIKHWRFAAGMTGISVMAVILTHLDKIILSKLLTLEMFGYYMLALNVANVLVAAGNPIFSALFPRISQLIAHNKAGQIPALYHRGCQLMALTVLPVAATLAFFSKEVISLWIGTPIVVNNTHLLLSLLVIGSSINALMTLPYTLMVAHGWTKLVFLQNLISTVLLVPLMIWMISIHGAVGSAIAWIILNTGYVLVLVPVMHRRLLQSELKTWYMLDLGLPVIIVVVVGYVSRMTMSPDISSTWGLSWIVITYLTELLLLALIFPVTRNILCLFLRFTYRFLTGVR